jgi:hypothetical protein
MNSQKLHLIARVSITFMQVFQRLRAELKINITHAPDWFNFFNKRKLQN